MNRTASATLSNPPLNADDDADTDAANAQAQRAGGVTVKPVVNAIGILRYLAQTGTPERAADIARHLAVNPSTCFNILRTLVAEDVVDFNPVTKMYSAGLGLARLVEHLVTQGQRMELAKPFMQDLAARFHVTITLWRRMGPDRIVMVSSEASPTDLRIDMAAGQRLPILMGASGRLFAEHVAHKEAEMRQAFEQIRWMRPLTFEAYMREVARAKRRGWATDDGYFANGIQTVAAPVRDASGAIVFTISAVMIRGHHDEAGIEALGEALRDTGRELSRILL
jgi:DNA-binding IclR family transcriptional regulator